MAAIVLFCLALLVCIVLGTNILYALLAGLVIFTLYGKKQGFSWKELGKMICSGVKTSASVLLVFPLIGILTAFWRACGTLPFIICCAVDLIRPEILLLMAVQIEETVDRIAERTVEMTVLIAFHAVLIRV